MRQHSQLTSLGFRFSTWLVDEFSPGQLAKSLSTGALIYSIEIIFVVSFAALIFSGALSNQISYGIGFILAGDAILCLMIAWLSSYHGSIGVSQDGSAAILAVAVATLVSEMSAGSSPEQLFSTAVLMIVGTTFFTGLVFIALGAFRLGGLIRFLPYPVIGGFLAGTGWLLVTGGISVMTDMPTGSDLLQPDILVYWLPGLLLGILMLMIIKRFKNPLVVLLCILIAIGLFYFVAWLMNTSIAELRSEGWLLSSFPTGGLWQFPLSREVFAQTNWNVLLEQIGILLPIMIVSVIALLLNANGLELVIKKDINLNHELMITGAANLTAGLVGGIVGYHAISLSTLNHMMTNGKRLSGIFAALLLGLSILLSPSFLTYIPKLILGAILVFLGISLLMEWVIEAWYKFPRIDFLIVILILAAIALRGFLFGIGLGVLLTIMLFVVSYSQIRVVKYALSGSSYYSRVIRSGRQRELLDLYGDQLYVLHLQGFIFFGTAYGLFEQVQNRIRNVEQTPVRFILLDFTQVPGFDTTGMLSFSKMFHLAVDQKFVLVITGLNARIEEQFAKSDFFGHPEVVQVFPDLDHAIEWCENQILAPIQADVDAEADLLNSLMAITPDSEGLVGLIDYLKPRTVEPGEYLIHQGDEADVIYFIQSGQVSVYLESIDSQPVRLETMKGGRFVGEIGFYSGTKRNAAVIADEPMTIYFLTKESLNEIELSHPELASSLHRVIINLLGERVIRLTRALNALQR